MVIAKDYSKCNQMRGGDSKWKKNRKGIHLLKCKKMLSTNKLKKSMIIENNYNNKKQLGFEICKLLINKITFNTSMRK